MAERLGRFAEIVGRERVLAGSDCGFSTFAGFGPVDPDVTYMKLGSMAEGARIASERLVEALRWAPPDPQNSGVRQK